MKRFSLALALTLMLTSTPLTAAQAASFPVSTYARKVTVNGSLRVNFIVKSSRIARARVAVYSGKTLVRTLYSTKSARYLVVPWNLRNTRGARVKGGTYTYVVRAVSGRSVGVARGRVWVPGIKAPVVATTTAAVATATIDPGALTATVSSPVPAPGAGRYFGAYVHGAPDSMQPVLDLESAVGRNASIVNFYVADSEGFPVNRATSIRSHGSTPLITWEFWSVKGVGVASIANGSKDEYIRSFARAAKAFGTEVWLRPFHEMNGNWYPWAGTVAPNTPADVIAAYKRVRQIFAAEGATNVKFVWCPNNESIPNTSSNAIARYWPGEASVDIMALDGYNFGTSFSWSNWRSFSQTFSSSYAAVTSLSSTRPVMIAETGCSTVGGSKAAWVADMFKVIPLSFPRIRGVVWFDTNAECDWRVDSDATTLSAFKTGLASF